MLQTNLLAVHAEIAAACTAAGRDPESVKLIAVSKMKPVPMLAEVAELGVMTFGESFVKELTDKWSDPRLKDLPIEWHFIGHLQSNKVKYLVEKVAMIHSVDSLSLAMEISKRAAKIERTIPVLLEVNASGEATKHGLHPDEVIQEAKKICTLPHLAVRGLMTLASPTDDARQVRGEFRLMKSLFNDLQALGDERLAVTELSMGMTSDFHIAIEEGSTMVRIGTAIFGERDYTKN